MLFLTVTWSLGSIFELLFC